MAILKLRAKSRDGYFEDIEFDLSVIPLDPNIPASTAFRHRIEIEGIDISNRITEPGVVINKSLDLIHINKQKVAKCNIPLKNTDGYFRNDISDNFWRENNLNPGGFLNAIKVYVEFLDKRRMGITYSVF